MWKAKRGPSTYNDANQLTRRDSSDGVTPLRIDFTYRSFAATKEEMENGVTSWDNVCDQTNMILREQTPCLSLQRSR